MLSKAKGKRQKAKSRLARLGLLFTFCLFPFAFALAQQPELPSGAMQAKARTACLECHDSRIVVQQRLDKKVWTREVDKMIRWGALVEAADRQPLIDYFSENFGTDKPPYTPPEPPKPARRSSRR